MTARDDFVYLGHVRDAVSKIESYVQGLDEPGFRANSMVQDAVIRQFEIIGEAVKRLSVELTSRDPETPWSSFAKFRDKLVHHYFGVDLGIVWQTIVDDLPVVQSGVECLLNTSN
jgi:uncharacterized protein with HEPN domain